MTSAIVTINGYEFKIHLGIWYPLDGIVIDPDDINADNIDDYFAALKIMIRKYHDAYAIAAARTYDPGSQDFNDDFIDYAKRAYEQTSFEITSTERQEFLERYVKGKMLRDERIRFENERRERHEGKKRQSVSIRNNRAGYVYLVKSSTGYYKIGRTIDPDDRMRTFSVKLPFEVAYEHLIKTSDMFMLESQLHNKFHKKRINGEWFILDESDVEYIKSLGGD